MTSSQKRTIGALLHTIRRVLDGELPIHSLPAFLRRYAESLELCGGETV